MNLFLKGAENGTMHAIADRPIPFEVVHRPQREPYTGSPGLPDQRWTPKRLVLPKNSGCRGKDLKQMGSRT